MKAFLMKFTSIKVLFTLFCAVCAGFIVFNKLAEFNNIAMFCIGEIAVYLGINVAQDKILK